MRWHLRFSPSCHEPEHHGRAVYSIFRIVLQTVKSLARVRFAWDVELRVFAVVLSGREAKCNPEMHRSVRRQQSLAIGSF